MDKWPQGSIAISVGADMQMTQVCRRFLDLDCGDAVLGDDVLADVPPPVDVCRDSTGKDVNLRGLEEVTAV